MPPSPALQLSLVLPCYNEAEHIERSVPEILRALDAGRWSFEIIFVDDASRDATPALIRDLIAAHPTYHLRVLTHRHNTGRGAAVSDGFRAALGDFVGYLDVDLEVAPHYIAPALLRLEGGADVCVGKRIYQLGLTNLFRHVLSRGYAFLARTLLGWPYTDSEAGFKFFKRAAAVEIARHAANPGWFWDTEVMYSAFRLGYRVVELPCLYLRRNEKTSTVKPVVDSLHYLRDLLRLARASRRKNQKP